MLRHLKIFIPWAIVLATLVASGNSSAQAATQFHCSGEPCTGRLRLDGGSKTSHHVFIIENKSATESVSFTCETLIGEAFAYPKTVSAAEVSGLVYSNCLVNGSGAVTVDTNFCEYNMTASGTVEVTGCPSIDITISGCTFHVPPQTLSGITYHNIGTSPTREITASVNAKPVTVTATGTTANCKINPSQTLTGTYTTGNTLVTGEIVGPPMADLWFE